MGTALIEKKVLTEAGADVVAKAAEAEVMARGVAPVIAVVDENGTLITMRRPDQAQVASVNKVDAGRRERSGSCLGGAFRDRQGQSGLGGNRAAGSKA